MKEIIICILAACLILAIFFTPSPQRTVRLTCQNGKMYAVVMRGSQEGEWLEVEDAYCGEGEERT